jgi:C-terminal processing protease CtpA/Prc
MSSYDRDTALRMLDDVAKDIQKHYYDPEFHGVDWQGKVAEAKDRIKGETSMGMAIAHIAWALDALNDSHTFFLPPQRPMRHDYGFQTQMIGDRCFITRVRPNSDAEAKGVKPGDQVLALEGFPPNRQILWKMDYRYKVLRPQSGLRLALRDPEGHDRQLDLMAKVVPLKRVAGMGGGETDFWNMVRDEENEEHHMRERSAEMGDELMVSKLPEFSFDLGEVNSLIDKARKHKALIVDLRDNPGGAVDTLKYLLGGIFENEVKIGDRVGRKEHKALAAKSRGRNIFAGKLIVLVDSKSASASELFARVVQLEKRGIVIGDRSSGSVMEALHYSHQMGSETAIFYGTSITDADIIMGDGKSLEHTGVTPNEVLLPSAADLASGRDPVLAHAAALLGVKLTPEDAGKMFPFEWPKL